MAFFKIQGNNLIILLARRSGNSVLNCSVIMVFTITVNEKIKFFKVQAYYWWN